jgi:hypothetical protein
MPLTFLHQFRSCIHWMHFIIRRNTKLTHSIHKILKISYVYSLSRCFVFHLLYKSHFIIPVCTATGLTNKCSNKDTYVPLKVKLRDRSSFTLRSVFLYLSDNMMTLTAVCVWLAQRLTLCFDAYSPTQKCYNLVREESCLKSGKRPSWCTCSSPFVESTVQ